MQKSLFNISTNPADVVYTPKHVSKQIIEHLNPSGKMLDPCKGDGAFYRFMDDCDYCEIDEGKDFFDYKKMWTGLLEIPRIVYSKSF